MSGKHTAQRLAFAGGALAVAVFLVTTVWAPPTAITPECRLHHNAAWISVDWTSQPVNRDAVQEMMQHAGERQLHYLFPYTTYFKHQGFALYADWEFSGEDRAAWKQMID